MEQSIHPGPVQCQGHSIESPLQARLRDQVHLETVLCDCKVEPMAREMGVTESTVSKWGTSHDIPAWRLVAWTRTYGWGLLRWIVSQCGGEIVVPTAPRQVQAPSILIGLLAHHSGNSIQQLIQDLADNHWSPEERLLTLPLLRKLRQVIDDLLHHAEGGEA